MIRIILLIFTVTICSYLFLDFLFRIVDDNSFTKLPKGCKYDGDCPVCSRTTIMYTNEEENVVSYWCEYCDWKVSYVKNDDGMWRKK